MRPGWAPPVVEAWNSTATPAWLGGPGEQQGRDTQLRVGGSRCDRSHPLGNRPGPSEGRPEKLQPGDSGRGWGKPQYNTLVLQLVGVHRSEMGTTENAKN